jgi:hypothetical protein
MMKAAFSLALWFTTAFLYSAAGDTVLVSAITGEQVRLNLEWNSDNHGEIQWQQSGNGITWENINGASQKFLRLSADSTLYFRAKITSGSCDPFYSSLTRVIVIPLKAINADSITGTRAVVRCVADFAGTLIEEWGLLYDTRSVPDISSPAIKSTLNSDSVSYAISDLQPGAKYFARPYIKFPDGQVALGNIVTFTTIQAMLLNRVNPTDSSITVWYRVKGDTIQPLHGIFIAENADPDTNSAIISGYPDEKGIKALVGGLKQSAIYHIAPFVKVFGEYCIGDTLKVKTCFDYSLIEQDTSEFEPAHKISWKAYGTARKISQDGVYADYGRIIRVSNSDTLLLVYHGGPNNQDWINIYLRKSFDNGNTWQDHQIVADINRNNNYWRFANPELHELKNGWILLAYTANGKPETNDNCYIHLLISKDMGATWEGPQLIQTGRSWEPSMVQLPGGEIEMFYSSEAKWWPPLGNTYIQQEIHMIRSTNNGLNWSFPSTVAWYPGKRDGMPVPLLLSGNRGVVFGIETVNSGTSPYIVARNLDEPWTLTSANFENGLYRWLAGYFNGHGGAPYLVQLPTGETVLSVHVYRGGDWHQNNYMQVMIGDRDARNFSKLSTPWGVLPANESAVNNSLFIRDAQTIIAVSGRNFPDGSGGIYWLEGTIEPIAK